MSAIGENLIHFNWRALRTELKTNLYENAAEICEFIKREFGVGYGVEGARPIIASNRV